MIDELNIDFPELNTAGEYLKEDLNNLEEIDNQLVEISKQIDTLRKEFARVRNKEHSEPSEEYKKLEAEYGAAYQEYYQAKNKLDNLKKSYTTSIYGGEDGMDWEDDIIDDVKKAEVAEEEAELKTICDELEAKLRTAEHNFHPVRWSRENEYGEWDKLKEIGDLSAKERELRKQVGNYLPEEVKDEISFAADLFSQEAIYGHGTKPIKTTYTGKDKDGNMTFEVIFRIENDHTRYMDDLWDDEKAFEKVLKEAEDTCSYWPEGEVTDGRPFVYVYTPGDYYKDYGNVRDFSEKITLVSPENYLNRKY